MKIGKFVQGHAPILLEHLARTDPTELTRLQDAAYSKRTLDINYPFCKRVSAITRDEDVRFYKSVKRVDGTDLRITSQWFNPPISDSYPLFRRYLTRWDIVAEDDPEVPHETLPPKERKARGRYKGAPIGNAQNAFIRHILASLGDVQFTAAQWDAVVAEFDNSCAYCGAGGPLVMDHVVPINRKALGEHHLGNLVPACRPCNVAKADQDYRAFLGPDSDKLRVIEAHMTDYDYIPMTGDQRLQEIIQLAHQDVRHLAERYVGIINVLSKTTDST